MIPHYAILLKAHYWDEIIADRVRQLQRASPAGHLFVIVDESRGPVHTPGWQRVLRRSIHDIVRAGLPLMPDYSPFWYNTDYPLYLAAAELLPYDVVVMVEHDVVIRADLDAMVSQARRNGHDLVAEPVRGVHAGWQWSPTINGVYPPEAARPVLTCLCLLSRAAWLHLFARRLRLGADYAAGVLQQRRLPLAAPPRPGVVESWPFSEAFMGTDLAQHGFKLAPLSEYGSTAAYDWWPPHLDRTLPPAEAPDFLHPVLPEPRYIDSLLRIHPDLADWHDPSGFLHARLDGCDRDAVLRRLAREHSDRLDQPGLARLRDSLPSSEWTRLGLD